MARNVIGGLIQCATPSTIRAASVDEDQATRCSRSTCRFIEEAGKKGVQILGLQEIFNGPYFCP